MPQETDPQLMQLGLSLVQWIGLGSLAGLLGIPSLLYYLRPRLTISDVKDKHPKNSYESRFVIKNIGQLPAFRIWVSVLDANVVAGQMRITDCSFIRNGAPISRLDHDETAEVPVLSPFGLPPGFPVSVCKYTLEIEHLFKVLFFRWEMKRSWLVELRTFRDGFTWQVSML